MEKFKQLEKRQISLLDAKNPIHVNCNMKKAEKLKEDTKVSEKVKQFERARTALGDLKNQYQVNGLKKTEAQKNIKPTSTYLKNIKPGVVTNCKINKIEKKVCKENVKIPVKVDKVVLKLRNPKLITNTVKTTDSSKNLKEIKKPVAVTQKTVIKSDCTLEQKPKDNITEKLSEDSHSLLIKDVENIDTNDTSNPLLLCEYVNDIYAYLQSLELVFPIEIDHLKGQKEITSKMRAILIDWIHDVHFQFNLVQETFHMAVSIIDRYLQTVKTISRSNLQLVGVAALFLASKYEELYPPELKDFTYITDYTYTKDNILEMERNILQKLDYNLSKPLTIQFLRRFSKAANTSNNVYMTSKYFIELSTVEYKLAHFRPSEIAAASIYLSLNLTSEISDEKSIWTPTLQYYTTYTVNHLKPIIKQLTDCIAAAPKAKLQAIYKKYQLIKFNEISTHLDVAKLSGIV